MLPRRRLCDVLLLCGLVACAEPSGSSGVAFRDSAGIEIAESRHAAWAAGEGWRISEDPLVEIGVMEGDSVYQLDRVVAALRLSDGRIVVANAGTEELRFYDPSGSYLFAAGREGGGPGEFKDLSKLMSFAGDSLLTWDFGNSRASIFDPSGGFIRSMRLPSPTEGSSRPSPIAILSDGTLLANQYRIVTPDAASAVQRAPFYCLLYDLEGAVLDTVGRFLGPELYVDAQAGGYAAMSLAFGRHPLMASDGTGVYYGSGDTYEIGYYASTGGLQRLIRKEHAPRAVTDEDRERFMARILEGAGSPGARFQLEHIYSNMPFPETMPPYQRLIVDAGGNLWVGQYGWPRDEPSRWDVFDPRGVLLGTVETSRDLRVFQIGDDFVLGRWRDELDVERVGLYELLKGEEGGA